MELTVPEDEPRFSHGQWEEMKERSTSLTSRGCTGRARQPADLRHNLISAVDGVLGSSWPDWSIQTKGAGLWEATRGSYLRRTEREGPGKPESLLMVRTVREGISFACDSAD